ncbi:MAG TPA: bifunctional tetrahydrofolate synthase/dihydrofolate synthase [Nevskiales bacterium]|nr:bifunctional tetrahydrofolate synthase/dihydrofolate synthase [Nevskiales bacterium]
MRTLADWLRWQEGLNPRGIALGLERMRAVAGRLSLSPFRCPVVTVGGTNGKGSCVAYLEAMLSAQGYRVCAYTSPHLLRYNERVRIAGRQATDTELCAAFERIEAARGEMPLTYFEFGTLAALLLFQDASPEAVILEVGLGGRLDAVNLVDADVALISSIGLDHTEWLGPDRESIAREKAGIFRSGRPAVCGDPSPPRSLQQQADALGTRLYRLEQDFRHCEDEGTWRWQGWDATLERLPLPALRGAVQLDNAAACVAALRLLSARLPVSDEAVRAGLRAARLPGRFQVLPGRVPVILDVAHNAEACGVLAANLAALPGRGRTLAVLGMLNDKPAAEVARIMDAQVHAWYLGGLEVAGRGQSAQALASRLGRLRGAVHLHQDIAAAFAAARHDAGPDDRIVAFGSFHTVEAVLRIAA